MPRAAFAPCGRAYADVLLCRRIGRERKDAAGERELGLGTGVSHLRRMAEKEIFFTQSIASRTDGEKLSYWSPFDVHPTP